MPRTVRLLSVQSVELYVQETPQPSLTVVVSGSAATPGYTNIRLNSLEDELSPDGIYDLEFVGDAPEHIVPPVVVPASASFVITQDVNRILGVLVQARTNQASAFVQNHAPGNLAHLRFRDSDIFRDVGVFKHRIGETFPIGENPITMVFGEGGHHTFAGGNGESSPVASMEKPPGMEDLKFAGVETFDPIVNLIRRGPFGVR